MSDGHTYEIVTIEGGLAKEIFMITIDDDVPMVTSDLQPLWFLRRKDAQRWIDDRIASGW